MLEACSRYAQGVDKSVAKLGKGHLRESAGYALDSRVKCSCCISKPILATYNHSNQGLEVVLTTWIDLGSCEWDYAVA